MWYKINNTLIDLSKVVMIKTEDVFSGRCDIQFYEEKQIACLYSVAFNSKQEALTTLERIYEYLTSK